MKAVVHKAETRGFANYGWLQARYAFSFAHYYNPERMNFGALRVLNDDRIDGGGGFPTHPHKNMEIITIPLRGALEHKDSMGNTHIVRTNDVQVMSAGTGVQHSEYNHSASDPLELLQLWIYPAELNHTPRYDQKTFAPGERSNTFQYIVTPDDARMPEALWIHQGAWLSLVDLDSGKEIEYHLHEKDNGVYLMVLEGNVSMGNELLQRRDAIALSETGQFLIKASANASLLCIEVPMNVQV